MKTIVVIIFEFVLFGYCNQLFSQPIGPSSSSAWHLQDKQSDGVYGISLEKAYNELLNGLQPKKKIIVAVIDSGVDTLHEDLKSVLWINKSEIPKNGIDDDKNGYIDDYYGWNFIGGKDGQNVSKDSYEGARVYFKYKSEFGDSDINLTTLSYEKKRKLQIIQESTTAFGITSKRSSLICTNFKRSCFKDTWSRQYHPNCNGKNRIHR